MGYSKAFALKEHYMSWALQMFFAILFYNMFVVTQSNADFGRTMFLDKRESSPFKKRTLDMKSFLGISNPK